MQLVPGFAAGPCATWSTEELEQWKMPEADMHEGYRLKFSKFNPTPGSGHTGMHSVGPNNFPFYSECERYQPVIQGDGGQLSEWQEMYAPSKEQAEADRALAFEAGIPHGMLQQNLADTHTHHGSILRSTFRNEWQSWPESQCRCNAALCMRSLFCLPSPLLSCEVYELCNSACALAKEVSNTYRVKLRSHLSSKRVVLANCA
eukprot:1158499-Pelagomonas_calceolata.AAC.2